MVVAASALFSPRILIGLECPAMAQAWLEPLCRSVAGTVTGIGRTADCQLLPAAALYVTVITNTIEFPLFMLMHIHRIRCTCHSDPERVYTSGLALAGVHIYACMCYSDQYLMMVR